MVISRLLNLLKTRSYIGKKPTREISQLPVIQYFTPPTPSKSVGKRFKRIDDRRVKTSVLQTKIHLILVLIGTFQTTNPVF